jgi:hypothetical protein
MNDIRQSIRRLFKYPGFSAIVVMTLALGIGANTAIFSVTDKLLLRSLPVSDPNQLVLITSVSVSPHFVSNSFSYPEFHDYRKQNQVFDGMLAFSRTELQLATGNGTERVQSEYVSGNYFDVLGIQAARGRTFLPAEDQMPASQPVVVVSEAFTRKHFSAGQDPLGQKLTLNGFPLTIVGVAPGDFTGMMLERPAELWVPVLMHPQLADSKFIEKRSDRFLQLLGRVKSDVSMAQAESGLDLLAQQIKEANTPPGTITKGLPFSEQHIKFEARRSADCDAADRHSATLRRQCHRSVHFRCDCVAPDSSFAVGLLCAGAAGDESRSADGTSLRVRPYANTEDRRHPQSGLALRPGVHDRRV